MAIGVLAIQGDVSEHYEAAKRAAERYSVGEGVKLVRRAGDMEDVTRLIIPGGESTTISRLMIKSGIYDLVVDRAKSGELAVMGTCAGSILMAKNVIDDVRVKTLGLMDMDIRRNAFGRQRESFEADVDIEGIGRFHAVFIRAPVIAACHGECIPMAKLGDGIIMARQGRFLALVFHPELTDDLRIYEFFFKM